MNDIQEKQLRLMRLQTVLLAAILVLLAVAGLFLMKQVNDLSAVVAQVDMDSINRAIAGLETAAGSLSQLDAQMLNETVAALRMRRAIWALWIWAVSIRPWTPCPARRSP